MNTTKTRGSLVRAGVLSLGLGALAMSALPTTAAPRYDRYDRYDGSARYDVGTRYDRGQGRNRDRGRDRNRATSTLEGTVTADLRGNAFRLRPYRGSEVRVQVRGGEPRRISRGDRVRVTGFYRDGVFHTSYVNIVRNR